MNDVYLDIEKYRRIAADLRQMAADISINRSSMTALMGFVGDAWQGTAADAFIEASEWSLKEIDRLRFDIEELASIIETAIRSN